MHAFHVRVVGLGLVATVLHIRPVRAAEPSAADRDTSRSLYAQGMEALDKHDYASAERACGGAYALVKVSTAATCYGRALEGLGKLIEARDVFVEATHIPARQDEPAVLSSAREAARTEADVLAKRIPTVTLALSGAPETAPLQVVLDGAVVKSETARLPRKVNPGRHTLTVSSPGFGPATADVSIAEGEDRRVEVLLHASSEGPESRATVAPPPNDARDVGGIVPASASSSSKVPAFIAFGVGAAGLVVGSIFGAMALSDANGLKGVPGCPASCPSSAQSKIDSLHRDQWASDVGLGVGIVGLAVGAVLFLTSHAPEEPPATSLRLDVGPGVVGLRGQF
jgi:hypothetical protein